MLGIGMERRQVDDVVQPTPAGLKGGLEVVESQADLRFEIRFG